jgi:lipoic acid synthetase
MVESPSPPSLPPNSPAHLALEVRHLGQVAYAEALAEQRRLQAARMADAIPDTLLLLEHPHVFTLGRNSDPQHLLAGDAFLRAQGATVERNERGGEVTYHGPGQLVGYPIILLRPHERSLTLLVDRLEETILRTLAAFQIEGRRAQGERGVWVRERKIASIGMAVRRWVVMHGMALNVQPDLRYFSFINPCGHPGLAMTSMALELGEAPHLHSVASVFAETFAATFGRTIVGARSGAE